MPFNQSIISAVTSSRLVSLRLSCLPPAYFLLDTFSQVEANAIVPNPWSRSIHNCVVTIKHGRLDKHSVIRHDHSSRFIDLLDDVPYPAYKRLS